MPKLLVSRACWSLKLQKGHCGFVWGPSVCFTGCLNGPPRLVSVYLHTPLPVHCLKPCPLPLSGDSPNQQPHFPHALVLGTVSSCLAATTDAKHKGLLSCCSFSLGFFNLHPQKPPSSHAQVDSLPSESQQWPSRCLVSPCWLFVDIWSSAGTEACLCQPIFFIWMEVELT